MRKFLIFLVLAAVAGAFFAFPQLRDQAAKTVTDAASTMAPKPEAAKGGKRGEGGERGQAVTVETAEAKAGKASDDIRAIGSLQSDESVQITTEIAGRVDSVPFEEGGAVKKGDVLAKLDDALAQAEVADAKAKFEFAQANLGRANALSKTGNVTERAQDEAVQNFGVAQAALELGKVRLSKHTIVAPFDGVVGIRKVSPGAYVGVGAPIVNLEKIDTLKVDFKVPEIYLSKIATGQKLEVIVDALPGETFEGEIAAIDPHVDVNGRALTVRATTPNRDGKLAPGLFARILVKGVAEREVVTVPESAIVPRAGETFVFRVEDGKAVEARVTLGARANGAVEIVEGLAPGVTVVTAGQQKLRNWARVEVAAAEPAPPQVARGGKS